MEFQDIVITKIQNSKENGYGCEQATTTMPTLFANFYEKPAYLFDEVNKKEIIDGESTQFIKLSSNQFFDIVTYAKRLALSFDTLLVEANQRANLKQCFAFVHVVGIGLGVWQIHEEQSQVFFEAFCKRIRVLNKILHSISDIFFSHIKITDDIEDGKFIQLPNHPKGGIKVHIGERQPHSKLLEKDKLLIVSYAWDGNSLPGNEFWYGRLNTSGDPAAACSTQIAELHNPHINPRVNAAELRIATLNGLVRFKEYQEAVTKTMKC